MAKERIVSVTLRVSEEVRELLRAAAEDDHRSMANMVEMLILQRCKARCISVAPKQKSRQRGAPAQSLAANPDSHIPI